MKLIREKSFYLSLIALSIPLAFQDLLKFGLNLVDNIMVGKLSEVDLSAVNLANQPFFIFSVLIFGLVSGGSVLITQYYGKNDNKSIDKVVAITFAVAMSFTIFFWLIATLLPRQILQLYTNNSAVIETGIKYLRIISWTYLLYGISSTFILVLRSVRLIKLTLVFNTLAFIINAFLDYCLVFGKFGMPQLGVEGAAIATLLARIFETVCIVLYVRFGKHCLHFRFKSIFKLDKVLLKDFWLYGLPVLINESIWAIGTSLFSVILGRLGTSAIAASSITMSVETFVCVVIFALGNASCIIVGNATGSGDKSYAKRCSDTLLILSVAFGLIFATVFYFFSGHMINFYNVEEATKAVAKNFMLIETFVIFFDSTAIVAIIGILRGGGDAKFAMYVDIMTLCLISVPGGFIFGWVLHFPLWLVFIILRLDIVIKSILCIIRLSNDKWIVDVTRDA